METRTYTVEGMSCAHCVAAVEAEVGAVAGVQDVRVDLGAKRVDVDGTALDDAAIRAAIEEAGYEAA
jgi:copper ion binding protein